MIVANAGLEGAVVINKIKEGKDDFGFNAQTGSNGPKGQLEYQNHARNLNVHTVSITSLNVSGNNASFSGTCTKNGAGSFSFTVMVQDNGEPGAGADTFSISVSGGPTDGGTITKGNIQIHQAMALNLGDHSADSNSALALAVSRQRTSSSFGRLAQLWNYVRTGFWLTG